ncbi:MAG: DNA-directed RNA polymerase subunit beta [Elusimicrobia bacterium RIFOXYA2_FULL_39_19]|nr:MAG: DNA-directed RNA polymerase subunit beta [Elusimicrobia bacterium RIFOXYA2_FULL_39_19]
MKQRNFAKLKTILDLPDLISLQKSSYSDFLQSDVAPEKRKIQGLHQAFLDVFGDASLGEGVENSNQSLKLQYINYVIDKPKVTTDESIAKDLNYEASLKVVFRLLQKLENGKIKELSEQEVYLCDLPLMTDSGSFIINGAERVVVTQIHRSPGVIFEEDEEKAVSHLGKKLYKATIIPYRGAWIDFEFDLNNILYVHIDKKRKLPATVLLRAIGYENDSDILRLFYEIETIKKNDYKSIVGCLLAEDVIDVKTGEVINEVLYEIKEEDIKKYSEKVNEIKVVRLNQELDNLTIIHTIKEDPTKTKKKAIDLVYKILHTPELVTSEIAESYLDALLFKLRRYDLSRVGRYKLNRKLGKIYSELEVKFKNDHVFVTPTERKRVLTKEDIVATMKYIVNLNTGLNGYSVDDIDHLGNRRIRAVGELFETQIRIGLVNSARFTKERMNSVDKKTALTPRLILNTTPLVLSIRRFFGTSQLSQFLDQTNPLAELTHKRRLSALGPGGLHRKRAGFEVRDVHHTHYGRICPIETPEGPNIGLITSMASYARVNEFGLIETPYRKVEKGKVTDKIDYLTADQEDDFIIAQANAIIDKNNSLMQKQVSCRHKSDIKSYEPEKVDYIDVSPIQLVSVSTAMIPFLEHDDANRALMGSNMQRQAVPLLCSEAPLAATGVEKRIAIDSYAVVTSEKPGEVMYVSSEEVAVFNDDKEVDIYHIKKYNRSNQNTCISYKPIVSKGDRVRKKEVIADGLCTSNGQIALGQNVLIAFMSWEGFNFEDAILVSDRVVREEKFTSIHIQEFQVEARDTKIGPEEITRDIPNVGAEDLLNLDENGIIRIGVEVGPGDILVGKTTPKGEQQVTMEERLLKAIFGKKAEDVADASLRVPPGVTGKVINVQVLNRWEKLTKKTEKKKVQEYYEEYKIELKKLNELKNELIENAKNKQEKDKILKYIQKKEEELELERERKKEQLKGGDTLAITVNKVVKVYVASKRRLQVGDKMAGRHGNKGVVSKIIPSEDMPRLPDGTPVDVVLSPLSIPSRMNVGQLLEAMISWAASVTGEQMITPVFDGAKEDEVSEMVAKAKEHLRSKGMPEKYLPTDDCRITLLDGRTGEPFMEKVTIGNMYLMKLFHMVEDKIHARSTGPYSLITRQPLGGKAQFGGQRFGEMEIWAIEGYGAAHTLREILTVKSDDVSGRTKVYEAIIKGKTLPESGIPEAFKVLVKELQGVALNIELNKTKDDSSGVKTQNTKPQKEKAAV